LDLFTVLLVLPLLAASSASPLRDLRVEAAAFSRQTATESAVAMLRALPRLEGADRDVARFLLATALAELGLATPALALHRALLASSAALAPAAFVATSRIRTEDEPSDALLRGARTAPWERMDDDDFAEAAYRVARSAFRAKRYVEARLWAREVRSGTPWYPFARYLLAQSEYALGRYGRALEAAEPIFSTREPADAIAPLRDRTAVLLGDMLIEIGLYEHAIGMLSWPGPESAWRSRARRDLLVARGLAELERTRFEEGEALTARAGRALDGIAAEIEGAVASKDAVASRARELRRAWPPRAVFEARRRWAANHALAALDEAHASFFGRMLLAVRESFPPVLLYRLARREPEPSGRVARLDAPTRFFFTPRPEVSRLLTAIALLEEKRTGAGCVANAAAAMRQEIAAFLVMERPEPTFDELLRLGTACSVEPREALPGIARKRLHEALAEDARARRRELKSHRYALDEALARSRLDHRAAARAAEGAR
jgi:hypothetical protein